MNDNPPVALGIDAGSKTLKFVALDAHGEIVFSIYHRHRSDVAASLAELVHEVIWRYGDMTLPLAVTGSAGIAIAQEFGIPFVQEVVATTNAVKRRIPEADCIIELGGEDAKITYLTGGVEQRMNATCAGGTGDFIDGISSMLGVKTREISRLALGSQRVYPIASRCAVFAQTDVRPLINAGAAKADIAQSALEAVVRQTLGGLACGRPIKGTVVFLGGPLEHILALVVAFRHKLGLTNRTGIKPADAHLFAAMGAIETAVDAAPVTLSELEQRICARQSAADEPRLSPVAEGAFEPLFQNDAQRAEFSQRHRGERVSRARLDDVQGPLFLGFDAGSTTVKYALVDASGALLASDYRMVEGDSFGMARQLLEELLVGLRGNGYSAQKRFIARAVVTGYGEDLLRAGLGFDEGIVETVAHLRAAQQFQPDASFVLDIGGQDMKALWIRDGHVVDAVLNEACSSGCGAFVQSSARSLRLSPEEFSNRALAARHPIDLGAKCTVFMTSRVRQAQKAGTPIGDIAAGIAYSVVNNVMNRIIGKGRAATLGDKVVVQGGAFKSDAVLRAFEIIAGVQAIRPDAAHLMGAYGAALVALDEFKASMGEVDAREAADVWMATSQRSSTLLSLEDVRALRPSRRSMRCEGCGNACLLEVIEFGNGKRFVSGNRCNRVYEVMFGSDAARAGEGFGEAARAGTAQVHPSSGDAAAAGPAPSDIEGDVRAISACHAPNVVALEQRLLASYGDVVAHGARGSVTVGFMNAMNTYEATPFWHTLLTQLGFTVVVPDDDVPVALCDRASETVPSESVCHPAKLAHVRCACLLEKGAHAVLMPRFERGTRCPVASLYADVLAKNVPGLKLVAPTLQAIKPKGIAMRDADREALFGAVNALASSADGDAESADMSNACAISLSEFDAALEAALEAQVAFERTIRDAASNVRAWLDADASRRAVVLVGRPYHVDPTLSHGIDRELARIGFAVIPELALEGVSREKAQWKPARHLVNLVRDYADDAQLEIVALRSFGCGYDAVSFDEAQALATALHHPLTELKIDDIADIAHIRIRLRTLAYTTMQAREPFAGQGPGGGPAQAEGATADTAKNLQAPKNATVRTARCTPDLCSTAKALVDHAVAKMGGLPGEEPLTVPDVCVDCLTDALPFELAQLTGRTPAIEKTLPSRRADSVRGRRLKVGLVGNPLLVCNPELNDHVEDLLCDLGCDVVYPDPALVVVEDVRFLEQLEEYRRAGVDRVIYLQSFGCLKGHVQARGAARELACLFPDLPITVIDYDAESSALNRENRIRLAVSSELES